MVFITLLTQIRECQIILCFQMENGFLTGYLSFVQFQFGCYILFLVYLLT
jgi:hypothetical protein